MFHPNEFLTPPRWIEMTRTFILDYLDTLRRWQTTNRAHNPAQYHTQYSTMPKETPRALLHAAVEQESAHTALATADHASIQLQRDVRTLKKELQLTQDELVQSKKLLFQANAERQIFSSALARARDLQENLLPGHAPCIQGLDICARSKPAQEVTGDFYDFSPQGQKGLTFTLGDISGKGMAAGLLMTMTRKVLRTSLNVLAQPTPHLMIDYANRDLFEEFSNTSTFATTFIGQFASERRLLQYANAGHSPVIFRGAAVQAQLLPADSAPIGVLPENDAADRQIHLLPGDTLVIGSDGITDARNEHGEMFGLGRLLKLIDEHAHKSASEMVDVIFQAVATFEARGAQDDDQTLMILKGV